MTRHPLRSPLSLRTFRAAGVEADVNNSYERRGVGTFPWAVLIEVPVGAFFTALATAAGRDAWKSLKQLVGRIYEARRQSPVPEGAVLLQDPDVHEDLVLQEDLPDQAWELVVKIDLRKTPSGQLRWDKTKIEWRDPWDTDDG